MYLAFKLVKQTKQEQSGTSGKTIILQKREEEFENIRRGPAKNSIKKCFCYYHHY